MSRDEIYDLLDDAGYMEHSPAQVAIYEEAVRLADALNDSALSVECRMELVTAATFSGADEKALVAFAWVLSKFDSEPECVDLPDLLWKYKWVVASITSFPTVSLKKIREMEDDMERRYLAAGYSLRPVHDVRADLAIDTGHADRVRENFEKWIQSPRDQMADCRACEQNSEIRFYTYFGDYEKALEASQPILVGGMGCSSVPQTTYGHVLIALMHLGRIDQARKSFERGYPQVNGNPDYIRTVSQHLLFMARENEFDRGLRCIEEHVPLVTNMAMLNNRMEFYCTASVLLRKLSASQPSVELNLPDALPVSELSNRYVTADLADWFDSQANQIAKKFDARNGNTVVTDTNIAWQKLATPTG